MNPKPVALTLGEPAGVGAEISLKAWAELRKELPFFLIGDASFVRSVAGDIPVEVINRPEQAVEITLRALPVLDHPLPATVQPGIPNAKNAPEVVAMIATIQVCGQRCARHATVEGKTSGPHVKHLANGGKTPQVEQDIYYARADNAAD